LHEKKKEGISFYVIDIESILLVSFWREFSQVHREESPKWAY